MFVAERAVRPYLADCGITYDTLDDCYADRANHRAMWFDAICSAYNTPDRARMGRELFSQHGIYCGLRNREEFLAMREQQLFDFSVWVDRSDFVHPEPSTSVTVLKSDCGFVLDNNGSLDQLERSVLLMISFCQPLAST